MNDCLIVGAGVIGLSLAYELARRGTRVRVVDRREPGREASWAGAGILPPANRGSATHPYDQLRGLSHELHREWAERLLAETGIDTGYRRCGGLYLARSIGEGASLHAWAAEQRELGVAVHRVAADELRAFEPRICDVRFPAAYSLPDECQLRNPRHLQALIAACRQLGVEVEADHEVTGFQLAGGRLVEIQTSRGARMADRYCFTAGAWTFRLLEEIGVTTGIFPMRGQMVLFRSERPLISRVVNEGHRYLVPREDGLLLAGSTEEETGFDTSTTESAIAELKSLAIDLVPGLRDAVVERAWAGLRPGSFDGFPYLGAAPGLANVFVAAGHFRSGLYLSPATAVVMSELILGGRPQIDLAPFRVGRG